MEQQDVENISEDIIVGFQRFLCNILLRHYITALCFLHFDYTGLKGVVQHFCVFGMRKCMM